MSRCSPTFENGTLGNNGVVFSPDAHSGNGRRFEHSELSDVQKSRCGRYAFVHIFLRHTALSDALMALGLLASPKSDEFLAELIDLTKGYCEQSNGLVDFTVRDLKLHRTTIGKYPCAVIELPLPRTPPEAYFAAIVLPVSQQDVKSDADPIPGRFFTLELGQNGEGPVTFLCEWTQAEIHHNYGPGPAPSLQNFLDAIAPHVMS